MSSSELIVERAAAVPPPATAAQSRDDDSIPSNDDSRRSHDEAEQQDDHAWAVDMEQRVWGTLPRLSTRFSVIDSVKCERPSCEIRFNSPDMTLVEIMPQLTLALGMDEKGLPIAKTMGLTHREVAPGALVTVVTFSTDPTRDAVRP